MAFYTKFYGLEEPPFEPSLSRRFYYVGKAQHEALTQLQQALSTAGVICVLCGPSGCGKTTLVRMLMRSLPGHMRIIAIDDPRLEPDMLLATILRASGVLATSLESTAELTYKLRTLLEDLSRSSQICTVILDEAQGLSDDVLEQLRLISNMEGKYGRMINFLLVGQEDLNTHLSAAQHRMLLGRIKLIAKLPPLTREETAAYISFRMQQAGCHAPVFSDKAAAELYKLCGGLPRLINSAADLALTISAQKEKKLISARTVKKAFFLAQAGLRVKRHPLRALGRFFKTVLSPVNLLSAAAAAAIAVLIFTGLQFALRPYLKTESFEHALLNTPEILEERRTALSFLLPGSTVQGRLATEFERAVAASLFFDDALNTAIALQGFQAEDGGALGLSDLPYLGVGCYRAELTLEEIKALNYPVILRLYDDNLTPFYGILLHLNADSADLIAGGRIFSFDPSYLQRQSRYEAALLYRLPPASDVELLSHYRTEDGADELLAVLKSLSREGRRFLRERLTQRCNLNNLGLCDFAMVDALSTELFDFMLKEGFDAFEPRFFLRVDEYDSLPRPYYLTEPPEVELQHAP